MSNLYSFILSFLGDFQYDAAGKDTGESKNITGDNRIIN